MTRRPLLSATLVCLAFALCLEVPGARAAYDPIGSGTTTLTLAGNFARTLKANGVRLSGTGGVTVKGRVVSFPVGGGKLEPVEAKGIVEHPGSLVFRAGDRSLPLRALQLKSTRRTAPYAAKLGGGQLKLATTKALRSERLGFGTRFRSSGLLLTSNVATRLDKKLGLPGAFAAGRPLGSATTTAEPSTVSVKASGKAELSIDPAFAAKLASLFVAVNPIAPAEHPGAFTLPIGGGTLALGPGVPANGLKTKGAIELIQVGGGQVFLRELEFALSASVVNGESQLVLAASGPGPNQAGAIFGLGAGTFSTEPATRALALGGAPLTLEPSTAQAMNEAFCAPIHKPDAFAAGETFGSLSFSAGAE
ncbi:MAG TPA: hypothetical protein VMF55_08065 [Solirubrobacterales bacterium]|nr:hypothetical protein [Solirubrobacterales bacterium]